MSETPEPICTGDCHAGDFRDFDHYCDSIDATMEETPMAFAAWLNAMTGWDGPMERLGGGTRLGTRPPMPDPETADQVPDPEITVECPLSKRVDGPLHSWRFDGDDPYVECVYCGEYEYRDARTGWVIRHGER